MSAHTQQVGIVPIPDADEMQMDRLVAVRVACHLTGPSRDARAVKAFADQFVRWFRDSRHATDRAIRHQVALIISADLEGIPEREAARIVKVADDLRSYIG